MFYAITTDGTLHSGERAIAVSRDYGEDPRELDEGQFIELSRLRGRERWPRYQQMLEPPAADGDAGVTSA